MEMISGAYLLYPYRTDDGKKTKFLVLYIPLLVASMIETRKN